MDPVSDKSSDESSTNTNQDHRFKCTYEGCNATFAKNSRLIYHVRRHTGERPFACEEPNCGKTYLHSFHLRRHKEQTHNRQTVTERIPCTFEGCYLELANKYSLKKHIKIKHSPGVGYPFNCDECQQGFHRKQQLVQHSYVHTGILPFQCDVCNTRFPTHSCRTKHKRTHTNYECDCEEKFERWTDLLKHKKSCEKKKAIMCDICGKTFTQKSNLKTHISETHLKDDDDVYCCGYDGCNRSYSYKKNLSYHIKKYHRKIAQRRIACTHRDCEQTFSKRQNLNAHIKRCHLNEPSEGKRRRKMRKDKGKGQKSTAALLAGLELPVQDHKNAIRGLPVVILEDFNKVPCLESKQTQNGKTLNAELQETLIQNEMSLQDVEKNHLISIPDFGN